MTILRKDGVSQLLIFSTKVFKTGKKVQKKRPPFTIYMFFHNKRFGYINLSSILRLDHVKNLFPDKLKNDELPSFLYSFGKTIRNKIINYKETLSFIDTYDNIRNGSGIVE